jgi:sugar/nucleoside kinase (ribokinase family)
MGSEIDPDVPAVVFIGSPTQDHLIQGGSARQAIGGAAFISALAARWAGSTVGLVARVPTRLPATASQVFGPGGLHRAGLKTTTGKLPGFRISYDDQDRATYEQIEMGMEAGLCADDIPDTWLGAKCKWIHIGGIGASAAQQAEMLRGIRHRAPHWNGTLSAGTCRAMVEADPARTLTLLHATDVFFLNQEEFDLLCPSGPPADHDGVIVVTQGEHGVQVYGGTHAGTHPAQAVTAIDPTGAGDSFCGGFIGASIEGHPDPVSRGIRVAANVLEGMGADVLLHWVHAQVGTRADHVSDQVQLMTPAIAEHGQAAAFDFAGRPHLPPGHPHALDMLCVSTLHQYGFWTADVEKGWEGPMIAELKGQRYKGSDFIWAAFAAAAERDPSLLSIERMASEPDLFERICTADDGRCPVPDLDSHQVLHQAHAQVMKSRWPGGYTEMIRQANASQHPVKTVLDFLRHIPGYMADPLAKKANLLAVILGARPEGFLTLSDPESIQPIVDYHMMRVSLRTGLVRIHDPDLQRRIDARMWVGPAEELAIRQATGRAILGLVEHSGCSVAAIDGLFFKTGRAHCVETETPRCSECPLSEPCEKHISRFQPVYRTTAY